MNDAALVRRLAILIAVGTILFAASWRLHLMYGEKFYNVTGRAVWIWPEVELSRGVPIAFFATRDFDLPANRYYTKIKVIGDPAYTLYFNGQEIGGRRFGDASDLDVYDVSTIARTGRNRIVVAVRSVNGVGGLLAAVDLSPEIGNYIVTDRSWHIVQTWSPALLQTDAGHYSVPNVVGRPPIGRWNYLTTRAMAISPLPSKGVSARAAFAFDAEIPVVKEVSGVAIASKQPVHATAYDFGPTAGHLQLTRVGPVSATEVYDVRYANTPEDLRALEGSSQPFVFAAGERTVIDPEVRHFRFARVNQRPEEAREAQDTSLEWRLRHAVTGAELRRERERPSVERSRGVVAAVLQ